MQSNFNPAMSRGITEHYLYEYDQQNDFIGEFFHDGDMNGAYQDEQQWEGLGLPQEHFPLQRVNVDGVRPSYNVRYLARSWTLGIIIPLEDKEDDLYGIIHKFFPMAGGEFARSYSALQQVLGAQFFGLYGFQTGTSVPFAVDGVSFFNTAHPMSLSNQATTWANRPSVDADLSVATGQIMKAALKTQKRPNGIQPLNNRLARVMVHPNEEIVARQIFQQKDRERGTTDNNSNKWLADDVDIVVNPYWEYSGTNGALQVGAAFNSYVGQGDTHFCKWLKRSNMKTYSEFDNTIFADIITTMKRFAYGMSDPRGIWGSKGA